MTTEDGTAPVGQGPRGERGETGQRGRRGPQARRVPPVIYLCVLNFALFVIGVFYVASAINRVSDAATAASAAAATGQRAIRAVNHQAAVNHRIRCDALAKEVAIPLPVPTAGNPSRIWLSQFDQINRARGKAQGCKLPPPRYAPESPGN